MKNRVNYCILWNWIGYAEKLDKLLKDGAGVMVEFLLRLAIDPRTPDDPRYIIACLRHEYWRLRRIEWREPEQEILKNVIHPCDFVNLIEIKQAIEDLPQPQKETVLLFYNGYSAEEIARYYNITTQAVYKRRRVAIKKLKQALFSYTH